MRKSICGYLGSCSIGVVAAGSVIFSMSTAAGPGDYDISGVPIADPTPVSCTTTNYSVVAETGPNGEFPVLVPCPSDQVTGLTTQCSSYHYYVTSRTGATISQSLLAISAAQAIDDVVATGSNPWVPAALGDGDSKSGFLVGSKHEYPIRMNAAGNTVDAEIFIKGASAPITSTMLVIGGKIYESCAIAGPGVPGNPFATKSMSKDEAAAGGKCPARLYTNAKGEVTNIKLFSHPDLRDDYPELAAQNIANDCVANQPTPDTTDPAYDPAKNKFKLNIGGGDDPLQFGGEGFGRDGVTFGTGTTTVYLPSGWAICTSAPCPGTTTYVFTY